MDSDPPVPFACESGRPHWPPGIGSTSNITTETRDFKSVTRIHSLPAASLSSSLATPTSSSVDVMKVTVHCSVTDVMIVLGRLDWQCYACNEIYGLDNSIDKHLSERHQKTVGPLLSTAEEQVQTVPTDILQPKSRSKSKRSERAILKTDISSRNIRPFLESLVASAPSPPPPPPPSMQSTGIQTQAEPSGTKTVKKATAKFKAGLKRSRAKRGIAAASPKPSTPTLASGSQQSTDILICGGCRMQFSSIQSLSKHKKAPCNTTEACQCHADQENDEPEKPAAAPVKEEKEHIRSSITVQQHPQLGCAACNAKFDSVWALCHHCQTQHSYSIFKEYRLSDSLAAAAKEQKKEAGSEAAAGPSTKTLASSSSGKETAAATGLKTVRLAQE
ncbi:hypothetical protein BaRGS_00008490 [Batillaria attramentaria]|uniref:C2H2-type domain-containing protein n=1 Tax=Batillaria attramentaria TaxID=370345 RepID=A0ABD0LL48_9CAEN